MRSSKVARLRELLSTEVLLQSITTKWGKLCRRLHGIVCFTFSLHSIEIVVSNADSLGSNVCINQTVISSSFAGLGYFISCPGANIFRVNSRDAGGAKFCQGHGGRPGIGIYFDSGGATVKQVQLACETENGTMLNVIDITVYFSECFCTRVR